jgi:hypothetical protein
MSLFSEALMADHTDHKLTLHALRRIVLGSVAAPFLHRDAGASSFLRELLNSRGEETFTPGLHRTLHRSLHPSAAGKARQINAIEVPKTLGLCGGWNDVRAGATPPFDARCVTVAVRSLPPSQELGGGFCALAYTNSKICQTRGLTICMKTKGEASCLY